MTERILVTMVNHVAMDIAASPDAVWRTIVEDYLEAKKFQNDGGEIEPFVDPGAVFGSYQIRFEHEGAVVDERIVRITELDGTARRLSATADYLSFPGGMKVYATYHAEEVAGATRYKIDCHTLVHIEVPEGDGQAGIARALAETTAAADGYLVAYLESIKPRVEGGA